MAVGDPARPAFGRAVIATMVAAVVFAAVTDPTKDLKAIYDHAPWSNDPFDTVYSFAMFFVPLVALACAVRLPACRRSETLPMGRVVGLLRGCQVAAGTMAITLLAEWASVAVGANRQQWDGITALLVGAAAVTTGFTGFAICELLRAPVPRRVSPAEVRGRADAPAPDWIADIVAVVRRESPRLGPLRDPAVGLLDWADRRVLTVLRRHPLLSAAVLSGVFALGVGGWQSFREGYSWKPFLLVSTVLGCGVFSFLAGAGSYLGIVRSVNPMYGARRRAADAAVTATGCTVIALAFRGSLWWIVGSRDAAAGTSQLAALIGLAALVGFLAVFAAESLTRAHALPAR